MQAIMILQAENHAETPLADFIRQVTQKIEVMAMVHRGLFHTGDLSRIDLSSYLSEVIESVQNHFPSVGDRVVFERRLQAVMVLFDVAVPLGLVVYELLTNALAHAFPDGREGAIAVVLSKDQADKITLELIDDGIGCNRAWSSPDNAKLGLQLVQSIVEGQLQGTITLEDGNGTGWRISFADIQYKERV
jgi:two-component sensor histidine kinase